MERILSILPVAFQLFEMAPVDTLNNQDNVLFKKRISIKIFYRFRKQTESLNE